MNIRGFSAALMLLACLLPHPGWSADDAGSSEGKAEPAQAVAPASASAQTPPVPAPPTEAAPAQTASGQTAPPAERARPLTEDEDYSLKRLQNQLLQVEKELQGDEANPYSRSVLAETCSELALLADDARSAFGLLRRAREIYDASGKEGFQRANQEFQVDLALAGLAPLEEQAGRFAALRAKVVPEWKLAWPQLMIRTAEKLRLPSWRGAYYREVARAAAEITPEELRGSDTMDFAYMLLRSGVALDDAQTANLFARAESFFSPLAAATGKDEEDIREYEAKGARMGLALVRIWQAAQAPPAERAVLLREYMPVWNALPAMYGMVFTNSEHFQSLFRTVFERSEAALKQEPLFWRAWGLAEAYSGRGYDDKKASVYDEKFAEATALAPRDGELWTLWGRIGEDKRSYDNKSTLPISQRLERGACYNEQSIASWGAWDRFVPDNAAGKEEILVNLLTLPDMDALCPSFHNYAKARLMLAAERSSDKTDDAAPVQLLERAAASPHPAEADALIYGHIGQALYTRAERAAHAKRADEASDLRQQAYVALTRALRSYQAERATLSAKEQERFSSFYWSSSLDGIIDEQLKDSRYEVKGDWLAERRAVYLELQTRYKRTDVEDAASWAYTLYYKGISYTINGTERARELLDLSLAEYDAIAATNPSSFAWLAQWSSALHSRGLAGLPGDRVPYLIKAVEVADKYLARAPKSGNGYELRALAALSLARESQEKEALPLLRQAYADFIQATGLPPASNRARIEWAKRLTKRSAGDAEIPAFMSKEAEALLVQAGVREQAGKKKR